MLPTHDKLLGRHHIMSIYCCFKFLIQKRTIQFTWLSRVWSPVKQHSDIHADEVFDDEVEHYNDGCSQDSYHRDQQLH